MQSNGRLKKVAHFTWLQRVFEILEFKTNRTTHRTTHDRIKAAEIGYKLQDESRKYLAKCVTP
jgi:hypothetical protein